ncbi:MAG TPA: DUF2721 domain-containing protein [Oscillatoriaceae cyanobacterium M33_DOE_052]|nr:DUF2721 domain-containing protein [Oscillatoriaceae cyanobacterium M33_DOE_052]
MIQTILAPAVMISATGLFLLSLNARHAAIFARIRILTDEKAKIMGHFPDINEPDFPSCELRFKSIEIQLNMLLRRARYIRYAIICQALGVGVFVLTSLTIGLNLLLAFGWLVNLPLILLLSGMVLILIGAVFLCLDEYVAYEVILMDVKRRAGY